MVPRARSRSSWRPCWSSTPRRLVQELGQRSGVPWGTLARSQLERHGPQPSRRCCAPSWRSRSSRRRSSSLTCHVRARDARSSSQLCPQLGLQAFVLERQARGRRRRRRRAPAPPRAPRRGSGLPQARPRRGRWLSFGQAMTGSPPQPHPRHRRTCAWWGASSRPRAPDRRARGRVQLECQPGRAPSRG